MSVLTKDGVWRLADAEDVWDEADNMLPLRGGVLFSWRRWDGGIRQRRCRVVMSSLVAMSLTWSIVDVVDEIEYVSSEGFVAGDCKEGLLLWLMRVSKRERDVGDSPRSILCSSNFVRVVGRP